MIYYSIYKKKRTCHGQFCISFRRIEVKLRHLTPRNLSFFYFIKDVRFSFEVLDKLQST